MSTSFDYWNPKLNLNTHKMIIMIPMRERDMRVCKIMLND